MDFGKNSALERVEFGSKCVLHRVRVSQCRPSRVIQNPAEQPPPPRGHLLVRTPLINAQYKSMLVNQIYITHLAKYPAIIGPMPMDLYSNQY